MKAFLATAGMAGLMVYAQAPAPSFDVASVKPNNSGDPGGLTEMQPGRYVVRNVVLRQLILRAYQLQGVRLMGGPSWIGTSRFDIEGRADANAIRNQVPAMLQSLLAERFKLAVHTETRELSIYALVLARRDGKLGPQMHESNCDAAERSPKCGGGSYGPGRIAQTGAPLSQMLPALSEITQHVVEDRTGLTGKYDLDAAWTPDQTTQPDDAVGPSIFTALQEQLGLKLEPVKAPVDVLVIDRIEPLTEN